VRIVRIGQWLVRCVDGLWTEGVFYAVLIVESTAIYIHVSRETFNPLKGKMSAGYTFPIQV